MLINKKITCHLIDFAVPVDASVKMKGNEKIDRYLDLARELEPPPKENEPKRKKNCGR